MHRRKFNTRWELAKLIDAMAEEADLAAGPAAYVVYLIVDPARTDPAGQFPGLPLYVGETSQFSKRLKTHMRVALSRRGTKGSVHNEIYRMAELGLLPQFTILETCPSRAASLEAEIRWAQHLLGKGYTLFNRLDGQAAPVNETEYRRYQSKRLWHLTLEEAYLAKISMSVRCPGGCFEVPVDIGYYAGGDDPYQRLSVVKRQLKPCGCCGKRLSVKLNEPS